MAQYYTGPHFWSSEQYQATATSPKGSYRGRTEFIEAVNQWMDKHNIKYSWSGESTHEHNSEITYYYHVKIFDDRSRTLFALRWS